MSVLQEIHTWSQSLPEWQSDAIRRLFANGSLTSDDLADLFALLKAENGIIDPQARKAARFAGDQVPLDPKTASDLRLLAMRDLRNVNAIASDQRLPFAATGLSVVYGDNGSGKSGYSRALKRACRARDQSEPIYPNAFLPASETGKARATFEYSQAGQSHEVAWEDGKPAPAILSSLAIFDSRCARSYLDEEGDFAYVPYGLDVLRGLADACNALKRMVEAESAQLTVDKSAFADLTGVTEVGKVIGALSHKTDRKAIETLATLSKEEIQRHQDLDKAIRELDPKQKARQRRLLASRITKIADRCTVCISVVCDDKVRALRRFAESFWSAKAAAELSAEGFRNDSSLLRGTGGEAWKTLFEAARKFAVESHPGKTFPDLGADSLCPLCQQPLNAGARNLRRFEEFVQQQVEKVAVRSRQLLGAEYKAFCGSDVTLGIDEELFTELAGLDEEACSDLRGLRDGLIRRFEAVKAAAKTSGWDAIEALPASPADRLKVLAEGLNREADALERMTNEQERARLQAEFSELDARVRLAKVRDAVLTAIDHLAAQAKLSACLSALKTNAISLKATELLEKVVSKELQERLNTEFNALGVDGLRVCLGSRTDKGRALHKLKFDLPQSRTPGAILSEGEQRAIAIASFLAEVNIGGGTGGVVFDDPVSSLDHKRRERVARRLAEEAKLRQVVVFTHDPYFVSLLVEEAQRIETPTQTSSLRRFAKGTGIYTEGLPFEGMNTKARVGYLRCLQQRIHAVHRAGDEEEYRKQASDVYRQLRIAWERAVEEVLLQSTVVRFRKSIKTQQLAYVTVEDHDHKVVDGNMSKCSNFAHDQALLGGVEVPNPEELLSDINALEEWRKVVVERSEQTRKKRKQTIGW